ncbi:MAG: TatD family hydrolase [Holophaga sp.]|nr:TatD family hydrolase [Holophaga sp.]
MLVDSHCHLIGSYPAEDGPEAVLARARQAGVDGFIAVATDLVDAPLVLDLAARHRDVQAALGLHPHEAASWDAGTGARLETLLRDPNVRFVGETGLDWHYDLSPRDVQETVFREHIRIARRLAKPVTVHTREAPLETLRILREEGADQVGGIIHCFSEDRAFAREALDLGFYLSFSGIVTFRNADPIREVAAWAPEDRILVETDSPFLAPVPFRGKPNEPAFVTHVAAQVARLRNLAPERLAEITTWNLEALCGWSPSS